MPRFNVRYLVARRNADGGTRYYWVPAQRYQDLGFKVVRLGSDKDAAMKQAMEMNAALDEARKQNAPFRRRHATGTVAHLVAEYRQSRAYQELAPRTVANYSMYLRLLENLFGDAPVETITPIIANKTYAKLLPKPRKARFMVQVCKIVWNYGRALELCTTNPWESVRTKASPPDAKVWSHGQVEEALRCSPPSVALAIMLAAYTGQRQGDLLALKWAAYDGKRITLTQNKTGKRVIIPVLPQLKAALDATSRTSTHILVSEKTQRPYASRYFAEQLVELREKLSLPAGLHFKHLRNTALLWLFESGCTTAEAAAITGHSIQYCQSILDVYFVASEKLADNASDKMVVYLKSVERAAKKAVERRGD